MFFKPGDTVRLKSGGPPMGVERMDGENVICTWLDKNHKRQTDSFAAVLLAPYQKPTAVFARSARG